MAFNGWFLLVVFLFLQAGSLVPLACQAEATSPLGAGPTCAAESCCCCVRQSADTPACSCAEAPALPEHPSPAIPSAPSTGRDLLPAPVWIEARPCARPQPGVLTERPARVLPRRTAVGTAVPVALTVRFCALLI